MNGIDPSVLRRCVPVLAGLIVLLSVTRSTALVGLATGFALLATTQIEPFRVRPTPRLLITTVGAALIVLSVGVNVHQWWAKPLTLVVITTMSLGAPHLADVLAPGALWLVVLMTLGGIYACVPETDHLKALAAGAASLAALEFLTNHHPTASMVSAASGVLGWAVLFGGTYRDSALIGGFASFGSLLFLPAFALSRRRRHRQLGSYRSLIVVAVQGGGALVLSRTAGLESRLVGALRLAIPTLAVMATAVMCVLILPTAKPVR